MRLAGRGAQARTGQEGQSQAGQKSPSEEERPGTRADLLLPYAVAPRECRSVPLWLLGLVTVGSGEDERPLSTPEESAEPGKPGRCPRLGPIQGSGSPRGDFAPRVWQRPEALCHLWTLQVWGKATVVPNALQRTAAPQERLGWGICSEATSCLPRARNREAQLPSLAHLKTCCP